MTTDTLSSFTSTHGTFRGSHALGEGFLTRHRLRSPLYTQLFHDVYVESWRTLTHKIRCAGAAWLAPETATLTGASAAAVYGFDFAATHDPVEFVVPEDSRFTAKRGMHITRTTLGPADGVPWHEIQLATPLRMTLDLLCNRKLRRSLPRTVGQLDTLLGHEFVRVEDVDSVLRHRRDRGIVRARVALSHADQRAESIRESELRVWLRLHDLHPEVQWNVYDRNHNFLGRLDLAFPKHKLAVEYDGRWHESPEQTAKDQYRRRRMRAAGWRFVVVTNDELSGDPGAIVAAVRAALASST
ncbi:hypothetical protein CFN78_08320 [Amycolatopsis antarctica]|uniref:DUF559 domain-containing protein n=2 Tax=Amycolatopsis antarctica TaxID=1854586 RepID=A0A263D7S6_9PSEU|nr:hypothetical protein CFN78_08320 [Amycolatopsis antarctica]